MHDLNFDDTLYYLVKEDEKLIYEIPTYNNGYNCIQNYKSIFKNVTYLIIM